MYEVKVMKSGGWVAERHYFEYDPTEQNLRDIWENAGGDCWVDVFRIEEDGTKTFQMPDLAYVLEEIKQKLAEQGYGNHPAG